MPLDPTATADLEQDPTEDTLDEGSDDTAQEPQGAVDWEARYKQLQSHTSRQLEQLKAKSTSEEEEDDDGPFIEQEPDENAGARRLERDSWVLAEKQYGSDAIRAYDKAVRLIDTASTPADHVAAFEAYHEARVEADLKRFTKETKSQAQPDLVSADSNRSDVTPRNNLDREAEAALAKGDSRSYLLAQIKKIRGE